MYPTKKSITAIAFLSNKSGTLPLSILPIKIPGSEPINNWVNKVKSKFPIEAWPNPATKVNGTACAISVPTNLGVGNNGYKKNKVTVPKAPAPIEVSVTVAPNKTPIATVKRFCVLLSLWNLSPACFWERTNNFFLNIIATEVNNNAQLHS